MAKRWKGDESKLLPVQQVEPYRLWFEFLKLAHKDPDISVNKKLYAAWDDVENEKFGVWWSSHWRDLFAVDIGVREYDPSGKAPNSERELVVRLPLYQDPSRTIAQVRELLARHEASARLYNMVEGQFRLHVGAEGKPIHPTVRFLKNLDKVRLLLNIYRFWIKNIEANERLRLELTALDYCSWAQSWNDRIRKGRVVKLPGGGTKTVRWNRSPIEIPIAMNRFVKYLNDRGERKRAGGSEIGATLRDDRRQVSRYIRKAKQIAMNTAAGRFPGAYE
jgi:hypothetical protein